MVNVAGQKSIDLANYFGDSSVHIVVYDLDSSAAASGKVDNHETIFIRRKPVLALYIT